MELVYSKDPFKLSGGWGIRPSCLTILFTAGSQLQVCRRARVKRVETLAFFALGDTHLA
jgi:hypothetical protein